ncbi:hypothetical protein KFY57_26630, partial [Salmonella enterica subsp. enterica serovar Typhimurium]|nr:hypothetical protein [Salmonella enterica subsp. enterica serovar Typhimurium]
TAASIPVETAVLATVDPEDMEEVDMETITMLMDMVELTTPRWIGGETEEYIAVDATLPNKLNGNHM